jgi:hypothetical protein
MFERFFFVSRLILYVTSTTRFTRIGIFRIGNFPKGRAPLLHNLRHSTHYTPDRDHIQTEGSKHGCH